MTRFPAFFNDPNRPCLGAGNVFYRTATGRHAANLYTTAIAACHTCPHMQPCRDWAITENETFGVWGGTTPWERRQLRQPSTRAQAEGPSIRGQVVYLANHRKDVA